jgi:hypothetical protein
MKTMLKMLAVAVITLPVTAWTEPVHKTKIASTYFPSTTGCIETVVFVTAFDDSLNDTFVSVYIAQNDICASQPLLEASGVSPIAAQDFEFSPNLSSARLITSVPVYDSVFNSDFNAIIDLVWMRTSGAPSRLVSHFNSLDGEGCRTIYHTNGKGVPTEASGSVTVGGTNYTPEPAVESSLSSDNSGYKYVNCP